MNEEEVFYKIIPRHDISTNWSLNNPILAFGEYGVEDDTHRVKRGDGVTPWVNLRYDTMGVEQAVAELMENTYVKKEEGKQLSTNDFTNAYRTKLDNLENYNDTEVRELIQTNTDNININANNIATNTEAIQQNVDAIDQINSDISDINDNIDTIESNIQTNTTDIAINAENISSLREDLEDLEDEVDTNTTNISTNATNIDTLASSISTMSADINTNATNIEENTTDIGRLKHRTDTLRDNLATEISDREDADSDLQDNIDAEELARQNADSDLQDLINGVADDLSDEVTARENADVDLQSQIDAINSGSDVIDVVGTYSELENYSTTGLVEDDVIKVLSDETHNDATTYYRWTLSNNTYSWVYIGSQGPFYTQSQTNELLNDKQNTIDANNKLDADLVDDSNSTNKFTTTAEITKLSGIEAEAQVNIIEEVKVNGTVLTPDNNKAVDVTVPTNTSDLTNDGDGLSNFATQSYVLTHSVTFKAFPSTFDKTHTTQDFLDSIEAQNLPVGMAYLGQVQLTDMPEGVSVQAEVEVYVYPQNVIYCVMRSAEVSPYEWECNSYQFRGWEPGAKGYAEVKFIKIKPTISSLTSSSTESDIKTAFGSNSIFNKAIQAINNQNNIIVSYKDTNDDVVNYVCSYTLVNDTNLNTVTITLYYFVDNVLRKLVLLDTIISDVDSWSVVSNTTKTIIDAGDVLSLTNTTQYTPSGDFNPATKKYVDDAISTSITNTLGGSY